MTEFDPTAKITRPSRVNGSKARPIPANSESAKSAETIDRVTLSNKPKKPDPEESTARASGEIRHKLVSKFRDILESGDYKIKANEIADKMVQKIREEKNRTII